MKSDKQKKHLDKIHSLRIGKPLPLSTRIKIGLGNKGKLIGTKRSEASIRKGAEKIKRGKFFSCLVCGSEFWRSPAHIKKGDNKFCSKKCYQHWQRGKAKISGFKLNPKKGKDNPNWKGGITPETIIIRNSKAYKEWRASVFKRDNYTCQECNDRCGNGKSVYLEAHHKKPFATHIESRFDVNNGVTLCKKCHSKKPKGVKVYAQHNAA